MNPITLIGILGLISGIVQIFYPKVFLIIKPLGVRSKEAIVAGGYLTIVMAIFFILYGIFK